MQESMTSSRRKICVVITARASYSRIRTALQAIHEHPQLELQIVVAGSAVLERYGNAIHNIRADGFEIDRQVYMVVEGENLVTSAKSTGVGLMELSTVFDNLEPDAVVSVGDRYETLATAIAAAYMNLPLAHIQGGEVTGSIDEKVRHAVTKLADLHLVSTELAGERVVRMGEDPSRVHVTGCPSIDLAAQVLESPKIDFDMAERYGGVGPSIDIDGGYVTVLQHPVTTEYAHAGRQVMETLAAVSNLGLPALWFWPNVDAGSDQTSKTLRTFREQHRDAPIHFFKHVDSLDFLRIAMGGGCIIGNSSVAIRECSYLGVPAVNIGTRQSGRERGKNVLDVGHDRDEILTATRRQIDAARYPGDTLYGHGDAGRSIAETLADSPLSIEKRLTY